MNDYLYIMAAVILLFAFMVDEDFQLPLALSSAQTELSKPGRRFDSVTADERPFVSDSFVMLATIGHTF